VTELLPKMLLPTAIITKFQPLTLLIQSEFGSLTSFGGGLWPSYMNGPVILPPRDWRVYLVFHAFLGFCSQILLWWAILLRWPLWSNFLVFLLWE
jgi:hypothetical protein